MLFSKLLTEKEYNEIGILDKNVADLTVKNLHKIGSILTADLMKKKKELPTDYFSANAIIIMRERATKKGYELNKFIS